MREDRHLDAINEVMATIRSALDAKEGMLGYQRRLMAMLSLGLQHVIELYLHRRAVLKPGAQLKHEWFGLSEKRLMSRLGLALTKPPPSVPRMGEVTGLAKAVETGRNDIVYGAPLTDDKLLRDKVDKFLELKGIVDEETGGEDG
jgi:hypothetical protein